MPYIVFPRCVFLLHHQVACAFIQMGGQKDLFADRFGKNDENRIVAPPHIPSSIKCFAPLHRASWHLGCCAPLLFSLRLVRARRGLSASAARLTLSFKPRGLGSTGRVVERYAPTACAPRILLPGSFSNVFVPRYTKGGRATPSLPRNTTCVSKCVLIRFFHSTRGISIFFYFF